MQQECGVKLRLPRATLLRLSGSHGVPTLRDMRLLWRQIERKGKRRKK